MDTPILEVKQLSVALPETADRPYAVHDISFSLYRGKTLCIVGESGSGKSVTAKAIMGMLPRVMQINKGEVYFNGEPLTESLSAQLRGDRIALIPQEPSASLNPIKRIGEQVAEVFAVHGKLNRNQAKDKVLELFAKVKLPEPDRIYNSYPHQVSGGQAQRVLIAQALALKPDILIADEPTTALDVTTQANILTLMNELKVEENSAILFVTHDFGVVADVADHIVVMCQGELIEQGSTQQVINHPSQPYTQALLAAVPKLAAIRHPTDDNSPVTVEVRELCRTYHVPTGFLKKRVINALRGVSFSLKAKQTLAVVGESGSGKSTLARCLLRMEQPDSGQVLIQGKDITHAKEKLLRPLRKHMQVVLQDPYKSLNPRQKVGDAVAEGLIIHGMDKSSALEKARHFLKEVGLSEQAADRFPHEFSGGQRQRICIARALILEPSILIADESVSALDVSVQKQILELLDKLQHQFGFSMIFITHDLRVASYLADFLLVMNHGEAVEYGTCEQILSSPNHSYTQALFDSLPGKGMTFGLTEHAN